MLKIEYDALPSEQRALVNEGYLDGYAAAIDTVESMIIRVGVESLDRQFVQVRNSIVSILKHNHELLDEGNSNV